MKSIYFIVILFLAGCSNSGSEKNTTNHPNEPDTQVPGPATVSQNGIVGEWQQEYTSFDKNGDYILQPGEKQPSGQRLGFNWFRFNADGTCLRDKDIKFKGTYEIKEEGGSKKLIISGGDNIRYTLVYVTENEMILGADGAFIIFKKIG